MGQLDMQPTQTRYAYAWHRGAIPYVGGKLDQGHNAMAQCCDSGGKALISLAIRWSLTHAQSHRHLDMAWA